jgi:hypothetical protein
MGMSLDDMIAQRRKTEKKTMVLPKKTVSNVDRSIATSRAKRNAAMAARRGIVQNTKPTAMQVEVEVKNQTAKSGAAKQLLETKDNRRRKITVTMSGKERADQRRQNRQAALAVATVTKDSKGGTKAVRQNLPRPPSKKAVTAAVSAMEDTGFRIPDGMQMVISFAPATGSMNTNESKGSRNQNLNKKSPAPHQHENGQSARKNKLNRRGRSRKHIGKGEQG